MPEEQATLGDQLDAALEATGVSRSELARRLADADDTKPESKRRWIAKVLRDEIDEPEDESLSAIAAALGLPADYFEVTPVIRESRRRTIAGLREQLADARGATARLESRVDELERALRRALGDPG